MYFLIEQFEKIILGWFAAKYYSVHTGRRGGATGATQTGAFLLAAAPLAGRPGPLHSLLHSGDHRQAYQEERWIANLKTMFNS